MNERPTVADGLELILETFARRFEFDARGRIVRTRIDGVSPRFVLGRSAEGCLWRFRFDLEEDRVASIAKLAGREPPIPIGGDPRTRPERLVMIERALSVEPNGVATVFEGLTRNGVEVAGLWSID